jgi:hypothetical protein
MSLALGKFAQSWQVRINLDERHEILHWIRRLGCSESQLRDAMRAVGPIAADVKRHLGR